MTTIALVLLGALTANAANLRSNSSGSFPACPQGGWTYNTLNGHCYKAFPPIGFAANAPALGTAVPVLRAPQWDYAKKKCQDTSPRGYLAVPNDAVENSFLKTMLPNQRFFLGYDQSGLPKGWWMDGTAQGVSDGYKNASTEGVSETSHPPMGRIKAPEGQEYARLKANGHWTDATSYRLKPVLAMNGANDDWIADYKTSNRPFICEMVFCTQGCNSMEKAPGTADSANTIVWPSGADRSASAR